MTTTTSVPFATTPATVLDLGRLRRLQRISDADGFIRVAAIDHPENYLALFDTDLTKVSDSEVVESKLELISGMAEHCSAVLVDPVWSLPQGVLTRAIPGDIGMISGLEHLAYSSSGFGVETRLREGWTVPVLAQLGADAAKLVVFYRRELEAVSASQHALVCELVRQCREAALPLVVEPLWYPLDGESLDDPRVRRKRAEAIVEAAQVFAELGADVLKVEFPGRLESPEEAMEACARLDAGLEVPWVLLSASATFDQFAEQLRIAAAAGACGFMAGRAIWGDGVGRHDAETRGNGVRAAVERLDRLAQILRNNGRPWWQPVSLDAAVAAVSADWFERG
jgi:tagatose-1,6-bisphosphate aldolase